MGDPNEGTRRQVATNTAQAVQGLQAAQERFRQDPLNQSALGLVQGLVENPFTLTPEVVEAINAQNAALAHAAAGSNLDQGLERLSTTSGVRSGAANDLRAEVASRLGETIAQGNRQTQIAAAQQRPTDIINALNAAVSMLGQQFQFDRDIAQANLGGASILGGLPQQPTPLQGLGGLLGTAASVALPLALLGGGPAAGALAGPVGSGLPGMSAGFAGTPISFL